MDYTKLINLYVGRECQYDDYKLVDHSDGNGVQIDFWNINDEPQPTIEQLEALQPQLDIIKNNESIKAQIAIFEAKLPRAITEVTLNIDSRIKDTSTGQTWLEYYNEQIEILRAQLR